MLGETKQSQYNKSRNNIGIRHEGSENRLWVLSIPVLLKQNYRIWLPITLLEKNSREN